MRQQLSFMTATRWRRRSVSKKSGGFLKSRRGTLRRRERTSQRLPFAWEERCASLFCSDARLIECKFLESLLFLLHRKRPSRRTEQLGWRVSFWTWLLSQTADDVLHLTDRVHYQFVSVCPFGQISSSVLNWIAILLLVCNPLSFREWARDENVFYKCSAHHVFKLCCVLHS